ncbi:MAG: GNAT family N-acetyltransferase [Anaerolineae bacterium]|nr:GNAT family N-acetyltransferase [Gemmatimonadaceae bacterium]
MRIVRTRSGHPVEVRAAEPADAPALLAYFQRVGAESPHLTFGAEGVELTEAEEHAYIARTRNLENVLFLVAVMGGELVGSLTFTGGPRPRNRHTGEFGVSVAQPYWGEGVGRALVEEMLEWAVAGGIIRKIDLRVRTDNARAIALYERLGFTVEGRMTRTLLTDGRFHDSFLMGRQVDPVP